MKDAQKVGLMTRATSREELSVMMSAMGRYFMNSPIMPGQKIMGAKAHTVVSVEVITGVATSCVPTRAPALADIPSCLCR